LCSSLALRAIVFLMMTLGIASAQDKLRSGNRSETIGSRERDRILPTLPEIGTFLESPSNRFLVDLDVVRTGHPYLGLRANRPHTGGHIYFHIPEQPIPAINVEKYPPIYAVADGVISRIDYSFRLRETYVSAARRRQSNTRYGIGLTFATSQGQAVDMHYSIEPFVDPGDDKLYDRFIFVTVGQRVKKGDIIARMYLPPDRDVAQNTHIHFNLIGGRNRSFQSPSIFDNRIVQRFHATWDGRRGSDDGDPIPPCLGYKLAPQENPFNSGPQDAL
jgi:hypothetical protein